jgi:hypothetical protein
MARLLLRRIWTKDEDDKLLALLRAGKSGRAVAARLRRSLKAVVARKEILARRAAGEPPGTR